jgi:phytol kinase
MDQSKNSLKRLRADETGSVVVFSEALRSTPAVRKDYEIPRKLFHTLGAIIPLIYLLSGVSREIAVGLLLPAVIMVVGSDLLRLVHPGFNEFFTKHLGRLMRKKEAHTLTTSTYFLSASLFVVYFFDKNIACLAIFFLSFGDPIAAIIGKRFGEIKLIDGKSLEGTIACFQVCLIIGLVMLRTNPGVALVAAAAAAIAELVPLPVNDNIRIPVLSALALQLML